VIRGGDGGGGGKEGGTCRHTYVTLCAERLVPVDGTCGDAYSLTHVALLLLKLLLLNQEKCDVGRAARLLCDVTQNKGWKE